MTVEHQPLKDGFIQVEFVKDHSSASYFIIGSQYREAAYIIYHSPRVHEGGFFRPFFALVGQSIELFLKAYLIHSGVEHKKLKGPIGHDLAELLRLSKCYGLSLSDAAETQIKDISRLISKNFFRYGRSEQIARPTTIPHAKSAISTVDEMLKTVGEAIGLPSYL